VDRHILMVEANRNRGVAPRVVDRMTAVGGEDELHAEPLRRFAKRPRLISRRRRTPQYALGHKRSPSSHDVSDESHLLWIGLGSTIPRFVEIGHRRSVANRI